MKNNAITNLSRRIDFLARHPAGDVIIGRVIEVHTNVLTFECEGTFWPIWKNEVSWLRNFEIENLVTLGELLEILVTTSSPEKYLGRFSLRELKHNPYVEAFENLNPGDEVVGEIADVSIKKGLRLRWGSGRVLVPRKELIPGETYEPGTPLNVIVQETNSVARIAMASRLGLFPDFYKKLANGLQVGDVVEGLVANVTEFGVFITLCPNLDGLVHVSRLGLLPTTASIEDRRNVAHELAAKFAIGSVVRVKLVTVEIKSHAVRIGLTILE